MPSKTLAQRVRDLGPVSSQFEELDPGEDVPDVLRPQTPTSPKQLRIYVTIPELGSPPLVYAVGQYFMCFFVPSEYLTNIVVVIAFVPPFTAVGQGEMPSSMWHQVTRMSCSLWKMSKEMDSYPD